MAVVSVDLWPGAVLSPGLQLGGRAGCRAEESKEKPEFTGTSVSACHHI